MYFIFLDDLYYDLKILKYKLLDKTSKKKKKNFNQL